MFEYRARRQHRHGRGRIPRGQRAPPRSSFWRDSIASSTCWSPTTAAGGLSDAEVEALIAERAAAKKARNFARADQIRQQLLDAGIILEDTKEGVRWKTEMKHYEDRNQSRSCGRPQANPDAPGAFVPVTTPIYTATSYLYEDTAQAGSRARAAKKPGFCYAPLRQPDARARWKNC